MLIIVWENIFQIKHYLPTGFIVHVWTFGITFLVFAMLLLAFVVILRITGGIRLFSGGGYWLMRISSIYISDVLAHSRSAGALWSPKIS